MVGKSVARTAQSKNLSFLLKEAEIELLNAKRAVLKPIEKNEFYLRRSTIFLLPNQFIKEFRGKICTVVPNNGIKFRLKFYSTKYLKIFKWRKISPVSSSLRSIKNESLELNVTLSLEYPAKPTKQT